MSKHKHPSAQVVENIEYRIKADINFFQGVMPEQFSLAWNGYIAGLYEWGVINVQEYKRLVMLLPLVAPPDPIERIFSGRE